MINIFIRESNYVNKDNFNQDFFSFINGINNSKMNKMIKVNNTKVIKIKICFYLLILLSISSNTVMSQNFSDLEIFLCIGQSNMAGRADIEAQDTGVLNNVYLLNASANWEQAENPLNQYSTIRGDLSAQKLGPSWEFGKTLQSYGKRVGLVVNAKGGSSISQWAEGTTFFNQAVARALAAQAAGGTIKGIIWHQGEADQGNANYASDFAAMIQALRTDLSLPDLPIIAGQIGKWKSSTTSINKIISELKNTITNVDFASATDLFHLGDDTHLDSESQRELGKRYAQKYLELTGQINTNTNIVVLEDTHVQGGSQAAIVQNGNLLRVRKTVNEGSVRKTWLKFDLSNYSTITNATLNLSGNNTQTAFTVSVFEAPDGWDETTLTWNNEPAKGALITTFQSPVTGSGVYSLIENIDITSYVQSQLTENKIVSIVLEDTANDDVQLRITNSEASRLDNPAPFIKITGVVSEPTANTGIYKDGSGKLNYVSDIEDNRIPDFSFAGYKSGEAAIPNVPVEVTIAPISGDNRAHIQAAIDQVSAQPLVNGIRGAVLLQAGTYSVTGSVYIRDSGVVLRGSGNGTNPISNTIIFSPEKTVTNNTDIIRIEGSAASGRYISAADILPNTESNITNDFLPVNSRSFEVDNVSLYSVGDIVCIYRRPESGWFELIDNGGVVSNAPWTTATGLLMIYPRKVTAINGNTVIVDQPIYEHIFGNGVTTTTMFKLNTANDRFISHVGLENLRITAGYNTANLNNDYSARNCVRFDGVWDSWATDVITENFWFAGFTMRTTTRITLDRCEALDPISPITGGYRYNYNMDYGANNILVKNCVATQGRHAYVSNGTSQVSGIVFLNSTSDGDYASMEGHRLWTQALLYDQITVTNSNVSSGTVLGLYNRGDYGSGHGWSAAHSVVWNSSSTNYSNTKFVVQKPPTAQNYALFSDATLTGNGPWPGEAGYFEGTQQTAPFASLYQAQLADRLAHGVLPDPPARVKAIAENGDLTITWLDNSGEEDGYVIQISTDNGVTYQVLESLAANTEQYITPMNNLIYDFSSATFQIYSTKGANKSSRRNFDIENTVNTTYNVVEDAYTQSGTFGDINYGNEDNILLKTSPAIGDNSRNGYLKFNLSNVASAEEISKVLLNFEVYYSNKTLDFNVYEVVDDTWSENTITYNNAPAFSNIVGSFATNGTTGGNFSIDVTDYVKSSLEAGDKTISFAIYDDNDGDGHIRFYSKENTVGGGIPALAIETTIQSLNADAYVRGGTYADSNYGTSLSLVVKENTDNNYDRASFLKFDLRNVSDNIASAKIRLKVRSTTAGAQHTMNFVTNDSWTETGITWNNMPATGSLISMETVPAVDEWIEFDVSSLINQELNGDGILSVRLSEANNTYVTYHSMDATNPSDRPYIDYEFLNTVQEDAYVRGGISANSNYGTSTSLVVKDNSDVNFDRMSFLKFDLSDIPTNVGTAKIKLKVKSTTAGAQHSMNFVSDDSWTETGITWNNKPVTISVVSTEFVPAVDEWIEFDVTSIINQELNGDGTVSVQLSEDNANNTYVTYHSMNAANPDEQPRMTYNFSQNSSSQKVVERKLGRDSDLEKAVEKLKVYPNPATTNLFIEHSKTIINVKIFSLDGRMIIENKRVDDNMNPIRINVNSLVAGVYILYIKDISGKTMSKKIMKY